MSPVQTRSALAAYRRADQDVSEFLVIARDYVKDERVHLAQLVQAGHRRKDARARFDEACAVHAERLRAALDDRREAELRLIAALGGDRDLEHGLSSWDDPHGERRPQPISSRSLLSVSQG